MKLKNKLIFIVSALMLIFALSSCSGGGEAKTDNSGNAKVESGNSQSSEKVRIRLLTRMAGTSKTVEIYNDILNDFKEKHPEVEIIDDSQGDEGTFNNILATDIASGQMANIFRIQGVSNLAKYIDNGLILDVTPYLEADKEWSAGFTEGSLSYYSVPGKDGIYAIPMESGLIGVYYNEKLLKEAGIEEFPQTWKQFIGVIEKLKANNVIPIALGEQTTYMGGHLHDQIFYKWMGTEAAKKLGSRDIKWTDEDVVQTLQYIKDLIEIGAFDENAAGITDDVAMTQFQQGEAAMVITGPWMAGRFSDPEKTPVAEDIRLAKFPYFEEKPEFRNHDMQVLSPYMISGKLEGKELELTIELVKMLTSKEAAKVYAEEASFMVPRNDIELDDNKCLPLFVKGVDLAGTSEGIGVDVFDFDPLTSMQDRTRNSILSLFTGSDAKEAAEEIQAEIDSAN